MAGAAAPKEESGLGIWWQVWRKRVGSTAAAVTRNPKTEDSFYQLTEKETEAALCQSRYPSCLPHLCCSNSHDPPQCSASLPLAFPAPFSQSLGPSVLSPSPNEFLLSRSRSGATFPGVFIAQQALGPLVGHLATYLRGIRSQEHPGQSSLGSRGPGWDSGPIPGCTTALCCPHLP